jgi:Beta-propeller repeat
LGITDVFVHKMSQTIADPPPTVTINQAAAQADPTGTSPINFTVVFNETVTGFATGDVTLSGTAGATTATVTGSGTTYNVAVSGMTANGTVIATIAAGVAIDAGSNPNAASTSTDNTVTYTGIVDPPPTVTINQAAAQADPTGTSPINFTVVFNETVTGFATGDVTLSGTAGATTAIVTGSGTTYNVAVSGMNACGGTVIATIAAGVAIDAGNNPNAASTSTDNTVTYNVTGSVSFQWAKQLGGTGDENGASIAVDASGNVYTTGDFTGTADFDPGAATFNLTAAGGSDIFVSKLDAAGNFVWAKRMGGTGADGGSSITVDASGNVYTTGYFTGTVDFDPGAATFNLTAAGLDDIFVSKLDAAGNFVFAKQFGGTSFERGYSITVDAADNIYTTGIFFGTVDFDPGAGIFNLTAANPRSAFVSKLNATGNFVWAIKLGGAAPTAGGSITVDASGNVYTAGVFFGGGFDSTNILVSKLDAAGNSVYTKNIGGIGPDRGNSIKVDASGNVYTTGYFHATVDFDPGAGTFNLISAGARDIFVSKLDAAGNFVYAKQFGGTGFDNGNSITLDASGNIYTAGDFSGTADFDPGAATVNLTSAGARDIFVSKLGCRWQLCRCNTNGGSRC